MMSCRLCCGVLRRILKDISRVGLLPPETDGFVLCSVSSLGQPLYWTSCVSKCFANLRARDVLREDRKVGGLNINSWCG